ncbi:MAG: sugar ABC transporter substrate-binding protein, partial [Erysipelotrichaceae bacterium]|nr:sugar ABC transporter substrate-binding protein [Erysipelotrichaceae bacterium]
TLLKELLPEATKVAVLYCSAEDNSIYQGNIALESCKANGLEATVYTVADTNDINAVANKIVADGMQAIYIPTDNLMAANMPALESITSPAGIPVIAGEEGMCKSGGYATYGLNYYELGKLAGQQAVAILKGEKTAADTPIAYLPAEGCTKLINKSVAERCGIEVVEDDPNCTYYTQE